MLQGVGQSTTGRVRLTNQDAIYLDNTRGLWVVADGMGGHKGGKEAARYTVDLLPKMIANGHSVAEALHQVHASLLAVSLKDPALSNLGCTVIVARQSSEAISLHWIGDCRAYAIERKSGRSLQLKKLTVDHTHVAKLVQRGHLNEQEARQHPQRHVVTQCLGGGNNLKPQIGLTQLNWPATHSDNRALLLCTDGLHDQLSEQQITDILAVSHSPKQATDQLIKAANQAGGRDNTSLVLLTNAAFWQIPPKQSSLLTSFLAPFKK